MRATASAVFIFILTIIGLGAGPQVIGILNDWIGTPDAIRYSLLFVAVAMNLLAAWFFWLTGKTLVEDLRAKEQCSNWGKDKGKKQTSLINHLWSSQHL